MKKRAIYFTVFAIIFAVALFSTACSIGYLNTCDKYKNTSLSGTEIMFQYKFVPYGDTDLQAMDAALKEKHDSYTGYSYYNPTAVFADESGALHYAYMAADAVKLDLFYVLSEGVPFKDASAPEGTYPVMVCGDYYDSYDVGDTFTMKFTDIESKETISVKAYVSGKMYICKWPEYVDTNQLTRMQKDGFVFCDDRYLGDTVDLSDRALYLNRDATKSGMSTAERQAFMDDASVYGVFADAQAYSNVDLTLLFEDKQAAQFLLAVSVILIIASITAFVYNARGKREMLLCTVSMVAAFILNMVAIVVLNVFLSNTLFSVTTTAILITLAVFAAGFIAALVRYSIIAKKDKKISEVNNYEEI